MLSPHWLPGRSHPVIDIKASVGPSVRVHSGLPVEQTLPDHLDRSGYHRDSHRRIVFSGYGNNWPAVSLAKIGGVHQHWEPLPEKLVDEPVTSTEDPAVLVSSVFGPFHQGLAKAIGFKHNERKTRDQFTGKCGFSRPGKTRKHQEPRVARRHARFPCVSH